MKEGVREWVYELVCVGGLIWLFVTCSKYEILDLTSVKIINNNDNNKELEDLEFGGRVEIIQTTILGTVRILRRVLETWGDLTLLNFRERPSALADVIVDFPVLADHRIKLKEREKKDKHLDLARELKKNWDMKVAIVPIVIGTFGTVTKGLLKGLEDSGSWRTSGDHPNDSIIEDGQNTEKSPGDLRWLAVTQTPVKNHQRSLMWKAPNVYIIIIIKMIIISEWKLAQKEYKARHDWVGKVIHWEMCRKFQFDHTNKWYMHNPAPVLENDSHKLLWNLNIQTDHLIPAKGVLVV